MKYSIKIKDGSEFLKVLDAEIWAHTKLISESEITNFVYEIDKMMVDFLSENEAKHQAAEILAAFPVAILDSIRLKGYANHLKKIFVAFPAHAVKAAVSELCYEKGAKFIPTIPEVKKACDGRRRRLTYLKARALAHREGRKKRQKEAMHKKKQKIEIETLREAFGSDFSLLEVFEKRRNGCETTIFTWNACKKKIEDLFRASE